MAKYHRVMRQCALRGNCLAGPLPASLETNYADAALVAGDFKSANFPFTSFKDLLRVTEGEIVMAVANNKDQVLRSVLADQTSALASGATIPSVGASGAPVVGVYGGVVDATNGRPLTDEFTLEEIRALIDNPSGWRKIRPYQFAFSLPKIFHTETTVKIDVCVWDPDDCDTAIAANDDLLFPDCEGAYVSGLGSKMNNLDPQFASLAASFAPEYTAWLTALAEGKTKP